MNPRAPIPLEPSLVTPRDADYATIAAWPFADAFVARLLRDDLPVRERYGACRVWTYRDPAGVLVGFGTLDVCRDYANATGGKRHAYIPLLAVNPTIPSLGYGTSILSHLVDEAARIAAADPTLDERLFLDVYTTSAAAIRLYGKFQFANLTPDAPIADPDEPGKLYFVMAKRLAVAGRD